MPNPPAQIASPGEALEIPASLGPADAKSVHLACLSALAAAREGGTPLAIELGEGQVWPCALQILAAARLSADAARLTTDFGPRARAALDRAH